MSTIGQPEIETQSRVITPFRDKTSALKRGVMQELLMLTFHANPQHLIDALGPQDVRRIAGERLGEKLGEKLGETRTAIINAMLSNARVTAVELARTLQISTTAVEKNLRILKKQGHIERIGPAKGGHWQVKVTHS